MAKIKKFKIGDKVIVRFPSRPNPTDYRLGVYAEGKEIAGRVISDTRKTDYMPLHQTVEFKSGRGTYTWACRPCWLDYEAAPW